MILFPDSGTRTRTCGPEHAWHWHPRKTKMHSTSKGYKKGSINFTRRTRTVYEIHFKKQYLGIRTGIKDANPKSVQCGLEASLVVVVVKKSLSSTDWDVRASPEIIYSCSTVITQYAKQGYLVVNWTCTIIIDYIKFHLHQ
ncbi:hypothetical protein ACJX0J_005574 [Zea mays]